MTEREDRTMFRPGVRPGTRLNGIYEIEQLIAVGGMGEVYKGRVIQTGDPIAIKMLRPDMAQNEAALMLFRKEAAALHNLYHEAIVRYYVFSVDPDLGSPYLAMEYVDGQPLSEMIKQGPLGYDEVRVLQHRLASGLQAAHELGIVHRDVSPDNVILPAGDLSRAKIIDFGIARNSRIAEATVIGSGFAGKFGYVSPEQLGMYGGNVTPRSDIYSLGLVIAEALTGRPLDMGGSQVDVIEKRRRVPDLSAVDVRMRPLLEQMLQPQPEERIATMADVAAWQLPPKPVRRTFVPLLIGSLVVVAVAGIAVLTFPTGILRVPDPMGSPVPKNDPTLSPAPPRNPGQDISRLPQPSDTTLAPHTPPQPPDTLTRPPNPLTPDQLARYVHDYEGGDCFLLLPTSVSNSQVIVEGFGSSAAAFGAFDEAFRRAYGFEAQVNVRLVTDAQCPAIRFIRTVGVNPASAPKLLLKSFKVGPGEPLSGSIEAYGGQHVDALLVSDDGYVHSLDKYTSREQGSAKFNFRPNVGGGQGPSPQLVLALASSNPLALLRTDKPMAADALFPLLSDEVQSHQVSVDLAVKYFRIEK
ncbi:serine/threonine-protein kinase [Microvirga pakistanensis]|uniref:serine/threonine-protein kinase n=1 Tax=Microvirga pakistanensis TaxID=1682650 RepID=UPI00106D2F9F|nr:serine/threonine-protein kinase [Microvirga pakistanensis]